MNAILLVLGAACFIQDQEAFQERLLARLPTGLGEPVECLFTPDGRHSVCTFYDRDHWFVVIGDHKGETFDQVGGPFVHPKTKLTAYYASLGRNRFVVV